MLTLTGIAKAFAGTPLFEDVSLQVNRQDRIGLVGPNGAGKSTLFSLILQQDAPDEGSVFLQRSVTIGYLPQQSAPIQNETVLELATAVGRSLPGGNPPDPLADLPHEIDHLAPHDLEPKAKQILSGLGFRQADFDRPARELSGGWVMRAHLARLLVQQPDLLMLDEPTNHLDLSALNWFQNHLKSYPGAILVISHDRDFLNQLVDSIVEIRHRQLFRYRGNYDSYLEQRQAQEEQLIAAYKNQQREISHLMEFVDRFRAKNTKAAQAQSKLKQIERMEKIEAPVSEERGISFQFPQPIRSGLRVISLAGIRHAYGENVVYHNLNFEAERDQRIVLVGPNGAGKSTLLKLLAGVLPVQQGSRTLGHNAKSGYYAQYRTETLNPDHTVYEEASDTPQRLTEQFIRTVLGSFRFKGDDVFKKVKVLSGGELSRLALVKLLLDPPNLLLMDEPTTHLDIPSIDALITALQQFQGTLVFISHDVYFIRAIANHVVHVEAGQLTHYPGGYQYYLDKTSATSAQASLLQKPQSPTTDSTDRPSSKQRDQKRAEAELRQARSRQRRDQQQLVSKLESQISALEAKQAELTAALELPETYQTPGRALQINRELTDAIDSLKTLTAQWELEANKLSAIAQ